MHAHTAGHFGLREAVLQQVDGPKSAGLKFREITSLTFGKCHAPHRSRSPTACHYILQGLIVSKDLITSALTTANKLSIGGFSFITLKKLRNSTYPKRIEEGFIDYFWMATDDAERLTAMERIMALRLRASAHDAEEFAQAAATQVVFHECAAIIGSLRTRLHFQSLKKRRRAVKSQQPATK